MLPDCFSNIWMVWEVLLKIIMSKYEIMLDRGSEGVVRSADFSAERTPPSDPRSSIISYFDIIIFSNTSQTIQMFEKQSGQHIIYLV